MISRYPFPPPHSASTFVSCAVGTAVTTRRTEGGKAVNFPPSGAPRTRQSAAVVDVPRPTTEVTPILGIATIRASIDAEDLDISGDDDDDDDDSGDDSPTINMMRKVEGGRRA